MFLKTPVPFTEAARAIQAMPAVSLDTWLELVPEVQAMCLTVSGLENLDAVKRVRDAIAGLPAGEDFRAVVKQVAAELTFLNDKAAMKRATLLVRMHGFRAYAAAAHRQMEAQKDVFPYRQYLATMDGATRPHHAALHGKVLPADHPFWINHTGPWEFNCRCEAVPLTPEDVDAIREQDSRAGLPPEERRILEGAFLKRLEEQGEVVKPNGTGYLDVRTPRERGESEFEWRAGDMGLPVAEIAKRYDPKDWEAWRQRAEALRIDDGRTVWQWLNGTPPPKRRAKPAAPAAKPAPAPQPAPTPAAKPAPTPAAKPAPTPAAKPAPVPQPAPAVKPAAPGGTRVPASSAAQDQVAAHLRRGRMSKAVSGNLARALELIGKVHSNGGMTESQIRETAGNDVWGEYAWRPVLQPDGTWKISASMKLKGNNRKAMNTAMHELGHKLDRECIAMPSTHLNPRVVWNAAADAARTKLVDALLDTDTMRGVLKVPGLPQELKDYYRRDGEIVARAYAQFIAVRTGDAGALRELELMRQGAEPWTVWTDEEFQGAMPLFDEILSALDFTKSQP